MIAFVLCVSLIKINLKQEDSSVDLNDGVVKANLLQKASLHNPALKYHLMVFSIFKFRHLWGLQAHNYKICILLSFWNTQSFNPSFHRFSII